MQSGDVILGNFVNQLDTAILLQKFTNLAGEQEQFGSLKEEVKQLVVLLVLI